MVRVEPANDGSNQVHIVLENQAEKNAAQLAEISHHQLNEPMPEDLAQKVIRTIRRYAHFFMRPK